MKVKAHKLQYKIRKIKERDERKWTLDTRIYPMVRFATKAPLRPRCWSTHEEYHFPAIKSLPWTPSRSPWPRSSLRELAHEGGVSVPRTILSMPLHTKPEGRWRAGEPPMLQRGRLKRPLIREDLNVIPTSVPGGWWHIYYIRWYIRWHTIKKKK